MAVVLSRQWFGLFGELRVNPLGRRLRGEVDGTQVVDTTAALLVWEPRRVTPSYAVPVADLSGELVDFTGPAAAEDPKGLGDLPPVLDPRTPFTAHSSPGRSLTIRTAQGALEGAAFASEDADLDGYVVVDFEAIDRWLEEDQEVIGHPRDPFHRIDCLPSSRHVVVSLDGHVLADSSRTTILAETGLPARYYFPRDDVRMDLLEPSTHRTTCAYKGRATYWSAHAGEASSPDIAWTYEDPRNDAVPVQGRVALFTERLDLSLDGVDIERPVTPWS